MKVLLGKDVVDCYTGSSDKKLNSIIGNIIFNTSLKVCFSNSYLDLLESKSENLDVLQALIKELKDDDRLSIEKSFSKSKAEDEFKELAINTKESFFIPIILDDEKSMSSLKSLLVLRKSKKINKEWITTEVLSKNVCCVCYQDFKDDKEIEVFFSHLFTIANYLKEVCVFDREHCASLLTKIKGSHIKYFTCCKSGPNNSFERQTKQTELQSALGGKLKMFYTSNPRVLHERKIIIENLVITIDNSRNNLTVNEPTWEITITLDQSKAKKWIEKTKAFNEVRKQA